MQAEKPYRIRYKRAMRAHGVRAGQARARCACNDGVSASHAGEVVWCGVGQLWCGRNVVWVPQGLAGPGRAGCAGARCMWVARTSVLPWGGGAVRDRRATKWQTEAVELLKAGSAAAAGRRKRDGVFPRGLPCLGWWAVTRVNRHTAVGRGHWAAPVLRLGMSQMVVDWWWLRVQRRRGGNATWWQCGLWMAGGSKQGRTPGSKLPRGAALSLHAHSVDLDHTPLHHHGECF